MSLICLIMAFFLDMKSVDGFPYLAASIFFAIVDCTIIFVVLGLIYA